MKTLDIIRKNFKILLTSRASALIVIFGPLLVIFLVGVAFDNSNAYRINIGLYSDSYSPLANSYIDKLSESKDFRLIKYSSEELCVEGIKEGEAHTCLIFPANLEITENQTNQIIFYVDYSKMNLVYMVQDALFQRVVERSQEVSKGMTNSLIEQLQSDKSEIESILPKAKEIASDCDANVKTINNISKNLAGINTSFNNGDFRIDQVENISSTIKNISLHSIQKSIDDLDYIKSAIAEINNSNANSQIQTLHDYLVNASGKIVAAENGTQNMTAIMISVRNKLAQTKSNLDSIESAKKVVSSSLNDMKKTLDQDIVKITAIQASLDSMMTGIDNIKVMNAENIVNPIQTVIRPITSKTNLNYIFPGLIVLVIMFMSILISSTIVMMEKSSRAHFRNYITPTSDTLFFVTHYLTNMILMIVQLIVILAIAAIFFKAEIFSNIGMLILILFIITTFFTLVGLIIGYVFSTEQTSTLASISISSVFLFLSNMILPIESMPPYIMKIAGFNPFVLSETLLKKVVLFNASFASIKGDVGIITLYSLVLLFITLTVHMIMLRGHMRRQIMQLIPKKSEKPTDEIDLNYSKHKNIKDISSIQEMIEYLESMDEKDFSHNAKPADLSIWARETINDSILADLLKETKTKEAILNNLKRTYEKNIAAIDKLKKEIQKEKGKIK